MCYNHTYTQIPPNINKIMLLHPFSLSLPLLLLQTLLPLSLSPLLLPTYPLLPFSLLLSCYLSPSPSLSHLQPVSVDSPQEEDHVSSLQIELQASAAAEVKHCLTHTHSEDTQAENTHIDGEKERETHPE